MISLRQARFLMTKPQRSSKVRSFYLPLLLFFLATASNLYLAYAMGNAAIGGEGASIGFYAREFPVIPARCPLILASGESATITVTIPANTTDNILHYYPSAEVFQLTKGFQLLHLIEARETLLPPGETLDLTWDIHGPEKSEGYLLIQMKIPARQDPHTQLESPEQSPYDRVQPFSYNAVCGIAIRSFLGFSGRSILFLSLAFQLLGTALLVLLVLNQLPKGGSLRISIIILAFLAPLGPAAALLPIPQRVFAYIGALVMYLIPLLFLILVVRWLVIKIRNSRFFGKAQPPPT